VSKRPPSKAKKGGRPIILPQAFAATQIAQEAPLLSGQQTKQIQELIDLLKKNNLTELELEREGLRIRVRHETGVRTITATVPEQGTSVSTTAVQLPTTALMPPPLPHADVVAQLESWLRSIDSRRHDRDTTNEPHSKLS